MDGMVEAVHRSASHTLTKPGQPSIRLLAGLGVEGDAHMGVTVKHRSRVARDPSQPNLRQVHLIHAELHDELRASGFSVREKRTLKSVSGRTFRASQPTVAACSPSRRVSTLWLGL